MFRYPINIQTIINASTSLINTIQKIIPVYTDLKPAINKIMSLKNNIKKGNLNSITNLIFKEKSNEEKKKVDNYIYSTPQFFL